MKNVHKFIEQLKDKNIHLSIKNGNISVKSTVDKISSDITNIIRDNKNEILRYLWENNVYKTFESIYPLSPMQEGMLFHTLYSPNSEVYITQVNLDFVGELNSSAFREAWQNVINRHTILRTSFVSGNVSKPLQRVHKFVKCYVELFDFTEYKEEELQKKLDVLSENDRRNGFDLTIAPLSKFKLIKLPGNKHRFIWTHHHILLDGWCLPIIFKEFYENYQTISEGKEINVRDIDKYEDFIYYLKDKDKNKAKGFWKDYLKGVENPTPLPFRNYNEKADETNTYKQKEITLKVEETSLLNDFSKQHHLTINTLVQSAWSLLLSRYSGENDVVFGMTVSGRPATLTGIEEKVGLFINTLPLRVRVDVSKNVVDWLKYVQEQQSMLREYEYMPLIDIQSLSEVSKGENLFNSILVFENYPIGETVNSGNSSLHIENILVAEKTNYPFSISASVGNVLTIKVLYNNAIYNTEIIDHILNHFREVLVNFVKNAKKSVSAIEILTPSEKHKLLVEWNNTSVDYSKDKCIHELFEEQVEKTPNNVAVVSEDKLLTYKELNERSNQMANYLQEKGVKPDSLVGICVDRSLEMMIGLLGILKVGGAYVPIDPTYPRERISYMLEDANCKIVLTQSFLELPKTISEIIYLDNDWNKIGNRSSENVKSAVKSNNLAYVIYTSGSTGRPKGVMIEHRSLTNLNYWHINNFKVNEKSKATQLANIAFDAATWEIWSYLLSGSILYIIEQSIVFDIDKLKDFITNNEITHCFVPTQIGEELLLKDWNKNRRLEYLLLGGDRLVGNSSKKFSFNVVNNYGPTENTVVTTSFVVNDNNFLPPIGKPIHNTKVYITDNSLNLTPIGVAGELCISGDGLARGYLNRPGLTAEKFIKNPFNDDPGSRLYKTGDLVKYMPDGNIEFIGRIDNQVKIRGFRIELGEVEAAIDNIKTIKDCVVDAMDDSGGNKRLVAYLVTDDELKVQEIRECLSKTLPDYMVPSLFVRIEKILLNSNGKIDRKALPEPGGNIENVNVYVAPRNKKDQKLTDIWREVLNVEIIGIHDNFFELGGHSLLATQIITKIKSEFNSEIPLKTLFENPTIKQLSDNIINYESETIRFPEIIHDIDSKNEPFPLTDVQQAYWIGRSDIFDLGNIGTHGYSELYFTELDIEKLSYAVNYMVNRHDMLRMVITDDGQQKILENVETYKIPVLDLRNKTKQVGDEEFYELRNELSHQVINVHNWPLFDIRVSIFRDGTYKIHFSMDGILFDASSAMIFIEELILIYNSEIEKLPPIDITFRDYVITEQSIRNTALYTISQNYWLNRIKTLPGKPELPLAKSPHEIINPKFDRRELSLDSIKWNSLQNNIKKAGVTPTIFFIECFGLIIEKWSKNNHFLLNLTLFNRLPLHKDVNKLIGDFTSLTILEMDYRENKNLIQRLKDTQARLWDDLEHRYFNGVQVQRELSRIKGETVSLPVVVTSVLGLDTGNENKNNQTVAPEILEKDLEDIQQAYSITQTSQVWLDYKISENNGEIRIEWDFVSELFPTGMLDAMFSSFESFLNVLATDREVWTKTNVIRIPDEQLKIQKKANTTSSPVSTKLMHELFIDKVKENKDLIAIKSDRKTLSYSQLHNICHNIGSKLKELDAQTNNLIAIVMHKGWEQIAAALGIQYSGAAYQPIDASLPPERILRLLEIGQVKIVVTLSSILEDVKLPDMIQILDLDKLGNYENSDFNEIYYQSNKDLAYVIFTSGSTGEPKGVMINHQGAVNTILDINRKFEITEKDCCFAISSLSFDLSVYDVFGMLAAGGTIVIPELSEQKDPEAWSRCITNERITVWNSVPALMQMLTEYAEDNKIILPLRKILLSGDWIPVSLSDRIKKICPGVEVTSLGGATEASIWSIFHPIITVKPDWKSIPYGKPLSNQSMYVLKPDLTACPIWVPGDLYIGGIGLALGYWDDKEKTAYSFIYHPESGERLYKTGDIGRYLPDGNIEFLGREDSQVKIQGYRIELGEIEFVLNEMGSIKNSVVVAIDDTLRNKRLVAYVISDNELNVQEIRENLSKSLPDYMIPSIFVRLDKMPLTSNGKVDRKSLPKPEGNIETTNEYVAPKTLTEQKLATIWGKLLGIEKVGIYDNFFELGGNSLLATQVISKIRNEFNIELPLKTLFEKTDLRSFTRIIDNTLSESEISKIAVATRNTYPPLSFAQERLWFIDQYEHNAIYNLPGAVKLMGKLEINILEKTFLEIIRRHEVLRTNIVTINTVASQLIHEKSKFELELVDYSYLTEELADQKIQEQIEIESQKPFDLANDSLIRLILYKIDDENHVLFLNQHHIISDAWSFSIFLNEVSIIYKAFTENKLSPLPELEIQYADYAIWQREHIEGKILNKQSEYWKNKLSGIAILELPTDNPRPSEQTFNGAILPFAFDEDITEMLNTFCKVNDVTLFMTLLTAFNVLLNRYTGQDDICVGSPIANRTRSEIEPLIGFFINTLALRSDLSGDISFTDLLEQVKQTTLDAYGNQDIPFEKVVEIVQPERNLSYSPLFQVTMVFQNNRESELSFGNLNIKPVEFEFNISKFDLTLNIIENADRLVGGIEYNTDLFHRERIERMIGHFKILLKSILSNPKQKISEFEILTPAEKQKLFFDWNNTAAHYPKDRCVHQLFEDQVERTPNNIAVVFEDKQLTYNELNEKSNQLAHYLQKKGVKPGTLVGICMDRSLDTMIGLLGILKAGGAYVPIDSTYPKERIDYMIIDSQCPLVLTHSFLISLLPKGNNTKLLCLDEQQVRDDVNRQLVSNVISEIKPGNLVYVIYTSGSTGRPNGVMIKHENLINFLISMGKYPGIIERDRLLALTSISFDIHTLELYLPLITGAYLSIASSTVSHSAELLAKAINEGAITIAQATPATWKMLLRNGWQPVKSLKILCGGEAIDDQLKQELLANSLITLFNMYGPTETTVWSSTSELINGKEIFIGYPIANTQFYITDKHNNLLPIGIPGELCIAGDGLALGYLKKPELTAEKFIINPFNDDPGSKLYKTGDLVKYLPDGNIEFIGRIDNQVKIRGFRIELGEIETATLKIESIKDCVVVAKDDTNGNKRLVAYLVSNEELNIQEIRECLSKTLPDYMVPSLFVRLEEMPLTPNGKVNRKALPEPEGNIETTHEYVAPQTETEQNLAAIWSKVLSFEKVGLHDNFFELGGDSIITLQIVSRANQENISITPKDIFKYQTIAALAKVSKTNEHNIIAEQGLVFGEIPLTPIQSWFFEEDFENKNHWNQAVMLKVKDTVDISILENTINALVQQHDVLRLLYTKEKGQWVQKHNEQLEHKLEVVDYSHLSGKEQSKSIEEHASRIQGSLSIENGMVFKTVLYKTKSHYELLIAINHLVVDGVSWRILIEDIQKACLQQISKKEIDLGLKTSSFKQWSERLTEYASSERLTKELEFWNETINKSNFSLPMDYNGKNTEESAKNITIKLDQELTQLLLKEAGKAYKTEINDLLLTSLAISIEKWTKHGNIIINLEGHGREDLFNDTDISRSVGWFTTQYPVGLTLEKENNISVIIKSVKEQLRRIPNKGIGYGILRYLHPKASVREQLILKKNNEISFNYLGQFDNLQENNDLISISDQSSGVFVSNANHRTHIIDINAFISNGELTVSWSYSENLHKMETIENLAKKYIIELQHIVEHCLQPESRGYTPSDFPFININQDELDVILIPDNANDLTSDEGILL